MRGSGPRRRADRLDAQVAAITRAGGSALAVPTDVSDPVQVDALVRRTLDVYGRVDILVNNVGGGAFAPLTLEPAEITRMIDANLTGAILLTRAVLPGMVARRHGCSGSRRHPRLHDALWHAQYAQGEGVWARRRDPLRHA